MTTSVEATTASWADVRAKARRIREDGGVRLVVANPGHVVAHVRGDTEVYETELTRVPGLKSVAYWACGCAWAAWAWGRQRFNGRMCAHALAVQYEAQSRGMFDRDIHIDVEAPVWDTGAQQSGSYDRAMTHHSMGLASDQFAGKINGVVRPLRVDPDGAVVDISGNPVDVGQVHYPSWSPSLGLNLHTASQQPLETPTHAGLALKAADTGRVLMIQRSVKDETDPAAGRWELPGGKLEEVDHNTLHGAMREWQEEVGQPVPAGGVVQHTWTSPDGVYQGHVMVIPTEDMVGLDGGRVVVNPDDPDGDDSEQAAWWDPDHARRNPALREECRTIPWRQIKMAVRHLSVGDSDYGGDPSWRSPALDEFGDLCAVPGDDQTSNRGDAPVQALPLTYGDEEQRLYAHLRTELAYRTAALATVGSRTFTPAEQRQIIDEGAAVQAGNLYRLDLTGTHYEHMLALAPGDEEWGVL